MAPSQSGSMNRLRILATTIVLLAGPVGAAFSTQACAYAGMPTRRASASHHRQPHRSARAARALKISRVTPDTMELPVPSHNQHDPEYVDLVVAGSGFRRGDVVRWDDHPLTTHFIGSTRLEARVPFGFLSVNTLRTVRPKHPGGSGPRGMDSEGATGTAWIQVHQRRGLRSNRKAFAVSYVVVGG